MLLGQLGSQLEVFPHRHLFAQNLPPS
jgi:hypothetical protein